MNDDEIKRLTEALSGWLDFQVACGRTALFSESFLAQPVGEYLQAHTSGRVQLEWRHPNLNPPGRRGRPRQIDYATFSRDTDRPMAAIEAKWAETEFSPQRMLDDLLRLECVRNQHNQHMSRYFLFSGMSQSVQDALDYEVNVGGGRECFMPQILPATLGALTTMRVKSCEAWMRSYFETFRQAYNIEVPWSYRALLLADETRGSIRTMTWRIKSMTGRQTFAPPPWP